MMHTHADDSGKKRSPVYDSTALRSSKNPIVPIM